MNLTKNKLYADRLRDLIAEGKKVAALERSHANGAILLY